MITAAMSMPGALAEQVQEGAAAEQREVGGRAWWGDKGQELNENTICWEQNLWRADGAHKEASVAGRLGNHSAPSGMGWERPGAGLYQMQKSEEKRKLGGRGKHGKLTKAFKFKIENKRGIRRVTGT